MALAIFALGQVLSFVLLMTAAIPSELRERESPQARARAP
jgi:hypothetical protein